MDQDRWQRVEQLYHSGLELEPSRRAEFLANACPDHADLRREVESLWAQDASTAALALTQNVTATRTIIQPGVKLGPYQVLGLLGAGGMGEVYRARDSKLGRDVALKTLPTEFARDPERLARFRREARVLASLNHPNIAGIYGLEESPEGDCLVLELVEGESLKGPIPIAVALDRAAQVAAALEAAHAKGIVHRDLKPANVKVTPEGTVKVLDFGLAKALAGGEPNPDLSKATAAAGGVSVAGQIVGTPGYMSPEQARGRQIDHRADIWAFGCLLYELLTGKRSFKGDTIQDTLAAVLGRDPEWQALPTKTPGRIRELLRRCLQKDPERRPSSIAQARLAIQEAQRGWNRWVMPAAAAVALAVAAAGATVWMRSPAHFADQSQWVQLTKFPDSVTQPALSPDGKMVAFIRGAATFIGPGQIYVKILPDGDPVQLTHDGTVKMQPVFSPDGSRIAYTTYLDKEFSWDTWTVPVNGGEPQKWLKNASGLVWTSPGKLLFSEIKMGIHMGVVAADENRRGARDIYLPMSEPRMAHRSYLSPDGKWVQLVEMDDDHLWEPCRVVPSDGSSEGHKVGPAGGGCTAGAWSPDGHWVYMTSNAVGANHIWRQHFPDGKPEQITSGPTSEEGIAMSPDGRSFITAVALESTSLWLHDSTGERQIPLEGNPGQPVVTPDGKKLLYRVVKEPPSEWGAYRDAGEVRITDLFSGRSEPVVRDFQALDYDLSPDGRQIVMQMESADGKQQLWLAPLDRSSMPRQIPNVEGNAPRFLPDGDIVFRRTEGGTAFHTTGFVYRTHPDGTGVHKVIEQPVLLTSTVSPDGKWLVGWAPVGGTGAPAAQAFPLNGGTPVMLASAALLNWAPDERSLAILSGFGAGLPEGVSYLVPLAQGRSLPSFPAGGFKEDDIARLPGARRIEAGSVIPVHGTDSYIFYRSTVQRNLYRIPIP